MVITSRRPVSNKLYTHRGVQSDVVHTKYTNGPYPIHPRLAPVPRWLQVHFIISGARRAGLNTEKLVGLALPVGSSGVIDRRGT